MTAGKLVAAIGNDELLDNYGYEPWAACGSIAERWQQLASQWSVSCSGEMGAMRQTMLMIHQDLCPDDERWR